MRTGLAFPLMLVAWLPLAGCNPTTLGIAASPLFVQTEHVNLLNASYAGADQLSMIAGSKFSKDQTVYIAPFEEIVHTKSVMGGKKEITIRNEKLGALMTDQLRARMIQLGYRVIEDQAEAKGIVAGVYEAVEKKLAVRLRLKDSKSSELYAMYDYWLPITPDIRRHMDPNSGGIPLYKMREGLDQMID